jgi:hypothetical protein
MTSLLMCLVRLYSRGTYPICQTVTPANSTGHIEISRVVSRWIEDPGGTIRSHAWSCSSMPEFLPPMIMEDHFQDNNILLVIKRIPSECRCASLFDLSSSLGLGESLSRFRDKDVNLDQMSRSIAQVAFSTTFIQYPTLRCTISP